MRFSDTLSLSLAALAWTPAVSAYANPGACSGVCNNSHDPAIIRRSSDGTYFRFSTGGKVAIHSAPSISGPWTYKCAMLPSGSSINLTGNQDLWAPDVTLVGDEYYVYYSVSSFGVQNSAIGLATSKTMDCNSFTDHGSTGVASSAGSAYNAIDPNLLVDGSNNYLVFGSFWTDLYQVNMASPPTKSSGSTRQLAYESTGASPEEGAYMVKKDSYYYLFYSEGTCCGYDTSKPATGAEYKIKVCRSSSATSGFVDKSGTKCTSGGGTIVLESHGTVYGPGGQGVYNDPTNGWVLYYHYVDTTVGYADGLKKFGWNKITWTNGWPIV